MSSLELLMDRKGGLKLYAYCDSTWESCPMTKKILTSHYTQMGNSLLPLFFTLETEGKIQFQDHG